MKIVHEHEAAEILTAEGSRPFLLSSCNDAWYVQKGHIDVFAVKVNDGEAASRRTHLTRLNSGRIIFGYKSSDAEYDLLAVGTPGTQLLKVDVSWLTAAAWKGERAELLTTAIARWINQLCAGAFPDVSPKEHQQPVCGEELMVQEDVCIRSPKQVCWIRHHEGESHLMGEPSLPSIGEQAPCFPVARRVWIQTAGVCRLQATSTLNRIQQKEIWTDLSQFHTLLLEGLAIRIERAEAAERRRLERKTQSSQTSLSNAAMHLAAIVDVQEAPERKSSDPLVAAGRLVSKALNLEIKTPRNRNSIRRRRDRLDEIARASRLRIRKVALRDNWWKGDCGPLLGLYVFGRNKPGRPVALLPGKNGYEIHDPSTGTVSPVNAKAADTLHPFAYTFYRPLAAKVLNARNLFTFGSLGCRRDFMVILLMGIAGGLLNLLTPIVTGAIFNTVIPAADRGQLAQLLCALLACAVSVALFHYVRGVAVLRVGSKMDADVQSAVWDRLLNLPTSFFRRYSAGDLAVRAGGISQIRKLLSGATVSSLLGGIFSVFNFGLLFYYDAGLACWAMGLTVIALLFTITASYFQLQDRREVSRIQSRLSGKVLQFITGITKLRVAGAESKAFEIWAKEFSTHRRLQFKARRIGNVLVTFNQVFPVLSSMVIFAVMILLQDGATMRTGDFIAFNAALGTFTGAMLSMAGAFVRLLTAVPIYEQVKPVLEALPEADTTNAPPDQLLGNIEVKHVSFRYNPEGPLVLDDVSIEASPGEFIALVGPSGSGKSTVLRHLLGFEEPEAGSIYYEGQELSGLDIQAVRRQIGVVLQNGQLMSGDIFTNIAGSSTATMEDAWNAARSAGLDEDIRRMPMGMHTVVSEGGRTLSGGQRQRLLIARAIVHKPHILFFDEATSALDNRTQAIVSESLENLQTTRIVVAHRLSTIQNADRIYVMDGGRIVQTGSYEKLLQEEGVFRRLAERQMA